MLVKLAYLSIFANFFLRLSDTRPPEKIPYFVTVVIILLCFSMAIRLLIPKKWCGPPNVLFMACAMLLIFLMPLGSLFFRISAEIGIIFNTIAIAANGGFMPVVQEMYTKKVKSDISKNKFLIFAADKTRAQFFMRRFGHPLLFSKVGSVGDILIYGSIIASAAYKFLTL